jgi:hypothetical protein
VEGGADLKLAPSTVATTFQHLQATSKAKAHSP